MESQEIIKKLEEHEKRIKKLEENFNHPLDVASPIMKRDKSLREFLNEFNSKTDTDKTLIVMRFFEIFRSAL